MNKIKPKNKQEAELLGEKVSNAKRFNILFKNIEKKGIIASSLNKKVKELSNFKEPVAILGRRNGHWEFFEDATSGWFFVEHSDGSQRTIYLNGRPGYMDYGKDTFKTYILHEDIGVPLPEDPITSSDFILEMQDKMQSDRLKMEANSKTRQMKQTIELIKTIGLIIGGLIGLLVLANLMGVDVSGLMPFGKKEVIKEVVKNATTTPII